MEGRRRVRAIVSFLMVTGGLLLLAFTSVIDVFRDPKRVEVTGEIENAGLNLAWVFLAAILVSWGVMVALSCVSRAPPPARHAALAIGGLSLFFLLFMHATLFINHASAGWENTPSEGAFAASYLLHTGDLYTFPAVYMLFILTSLLLTALVGACAFLVAPGRFSALFGRHSNWSSNESTLVTTSLFMVLSLVVFLVSYVRMAIDADIEPNSRGFLADNLVALHYLTAALLGLLVLVISGRVFLVNWGTLGSFRRVRLLETLSNLQRVERVLLGAVIAFNLLLLLAPRIVGLYYFSDDRVFGFTPRFLYSFFLILLIPYAVYAASLRRLTRLLEEGRGPPAGTTPFTSASLRLVLIHLGGVVLLTALFVGLDSRGSVDPLVIMMSYAAFTAGAFLYAGVDWSIAAGVIRVRLKGEAGAAPFYGFLVMAIVTALLLWGAGNTYVGTYHAGTNTITVENASVWGADVLSRFAAVLLASLTLVTALAVLSEAARVRRPMLGRYLFMSVAIMAGALLAFSVGVWSSTRNVEGTVDAFAGMAFHQYGVLEATLVAVVLVASVATVYVTAGRILDWTTQRWALLRAPARDG